MQPDRYGLTPKSYLLINDGKGNFTDQTASLAPSLSELGMVTDAQWADVDGNGKPALVVVGEWMPIVILRNENGVWQPHLADSVGAVPPDQLSSSRWTGLWQSVAVADFDADGDLDLVAGNLGKNSFLKASEQQPISLYAKDFDASGSIDPIISHYRKGYDGLPREYPLAARDELIDQMSLMRRRFARYRDYSLVKMEELFPPPVFVGAVKKNAKQLASCYLENDGSGKFTLHELPIEAQFSPIHTLLAGDFDQDGSLDLLFGGNLFGVVPSLGRYDAQAVGWLRGLGKGQWQATSLADHGLDLEGQVNAIRPIKTMGSEAVLIGINNDRLRLWRTNSGKITP